MKHKDAGLVSLLKACATHKDLNGGSRLHAHILDRELLKKNIFLGSSLINMYAKCGALLKAQEVFDELPVQDVVSWTALIAGYAQYGHGYDALACFEKMQEEGLSPNAMTFACLLRACATIGACEKGKEIHAEIARMGFLGKDIVLGNALVDMYSKCGAFAWARQVLDALVARDVVCWTALISGYCQQEYGEEALDCFEQMQREGISPNAVTFACILQACGSIRAAEKGNEVHAEIIQMGLLENDGVLGNALLDMYVKCGALNKAQSVFDKLPIRDVVSWTTLITGYAQQGHAEKALKCFEQMLGDGLSPNAVTWLCLLQACGSIGAAKLGEELHAEILREGWLGKESALDTALVDMYAKCGAVEKAQQIFDELSVQNEVTWTALMAGYAQAGRQDIVFDSFRRMLGQGTKPNLVTFTIVLTACSYVGLVDEGETYFESMSASFGIIPTLEHHTCMVDLFGRAGHFDRAVAAIKKMPTVDHLPVWFALLGACQKWGNMSTARWAYENVVRLGEGSDAAYSSRSVMHAAPGLQEYIGSVKEAWHMPGCCWGTECC